MEGIWYRGPHNQSHVMFCTVHFALFIGFLCSEEKCRVVINERRAPWVEIRWGGRRTSLTTGGLNTSLCIRRWSSPQGACMIREVSRFPHPRPPEIPLGLLSTNVNTSVMLGAKHDPLCYCVLWQSLLILPVTAAGTFCHWSCFREAAEMVSSPIPSLSSWIRDTELASEVRKEESTFLKAWPRFLLALKVKRDPFKQWYMTGFIWCQYCCWPALPQGCAIQALNFILISIWSWRSAGNCNNLAHVGMQKNTSKREEYNPFTSEIKEALFSHGCCLGS